MKRYGGSSTSRRRDFCTSVWSLCVLAVVVLSKNDEEEETHPDPNHENHPGMIYIGRLEGENDEDRRRVGFDFDNGE